MDAKMASWTLKGILVGVCILRSVCSLYGVTAGQQARKEEPLLMLSYLTVFTVPTQDLSYIMLTVAGLWSLKDVWVFFKSN